MSWLDDVPLSHNVFVFRYSLLCEACGTSIQLKQPRSADPNIYPQGPVDQGGGSSDSAEFCANGRSCKSPATVAGHKIGCPLGCPLTDEGARNVQETIFRDLLSEKKFGRLMGRLLRRIWQAYTEPERLVRPRGPVTLPPSLSKLISRAFGRRNLEVDRTIIESLHVDTDHVYFIVPQGAIASLVRATATDEGEFERVDMAAVPLHVVASSGAYSLLSEAASEGAWD